MCINQFWPTKKKDKWAGPWCGRGDGPGLAKPAYGCAWRAALVEDFELASDGCA